MAVLVPVRHPQASRLVATGSQVRRRLELRKQAGGHPMILVTTLAVGALAGMMLAPASSSALASFEPPANAAEDAHTTAKTSRLPRAAVVSRARGKAEAEMAPKACTPSPVPDRRRPIAYV